jgi:hypothetical protein
VEHSTVVHGDGVSWTKQTAPTENALFASWTDGPDVWIVGTWGTILRGAR